MTQTQTHTHTRARMHARTHRHPRTHIHTRAHTHTHTPTHPHLHTNTHTCTQTHTHTHMIELTGECLKCLFRLTGGVPAVVVQSEARWARIPEIQVRIPSRAMGTFFPHTVSSIFRLSLTHTQTHDHQRQCFFFDNVSTPQPFQVNLESKMSLKTGADLPDAKLDSLRRRITFHATCDFRTRSFGSFRCDRVQYSVKLALHITV